MRCVFDHLVVSASSLEEGVAWIERTLGVSVGPGGRHPQMGTHNRLLRLGQSAFLEVIAIDPEASSPTHPRWFGLDDACAMRAPRLAAWVARTDDLLAWPTAMLAPMGHIKTMTRGEREWLITVPVDGTPLLNGAVPALIEWRRPQRSAAFDLPDAGCALATFEIRHPDPAHVQASLAGLGLADVVSISFGRPALRAVIDTPAGQCVIGEFEH